jgi:FkbM family methyltransferase
VIDGTVALARAITAHPLAGRQPLQTAARILGWQIRSRLSSGTYNMPWIGDSRLLVRRGMTGATGNLYFGLHEFSEMGFLLHMLGRDDVFLDIGANIGSFSVLEARVCGARCHAFEPAPETAHWLEANVAANRIEDRVTVHRVALGNADGVVAFTKGLDSVNRFATADEVQQEVPIRRLDDVIAGVNPTLIKIDVEGYEDEVFAGAEQMLANPSLLAVTTETLSAAAESRFERLGFVRRYYDPFSRELLIDPPRWGDSNSLLVRDVAAVAERLRHASAVTVLGTRI